MVSTSRILDEVDASTDTISDCSSLDPSDLGFRLSQLSRAKVAMMLNSVHHVRMCRACDREAHVTVYVLDVFLHSAPRGLPRVTAVTTTELQRMSRSKGKRREELHQQHDLCVDYQVEHRYSTFRTLRERIGEVVTTPKDKSHSQWCPYCSRVRELVSSGVFPPRFPTRGRVAIASGLHDYVVRSREKRLEKFVNQLLCAAKDISYRSGCNPCDRFEVVSGLLNDFLTEVHLRA